MISDTHNPLPDREAIEVICTGLGTIGRNLAFVQILNTREFHNAYTRFSLYKELVPDLNDPMLNGSTSSMIRSLQFQDIIRQKISHVQETNRSLYRALHEFLEGLSSEEAVNKYLVQLNDISRVQTAQLSFAGRQFQTSIEDMVTQLGIIHAAAVHICETDELLPRVMSLDDFNIPAFKEELDSVIMTFSAFTGIINTSGRLKFSKERTENLNRLKKLYTMDSEHAIHKNVVEDFTHADIDAFILQQAVESKQEGDLELF